MEIITGYVGKPHVTSEQDRDVHIGMIGSGSYVLQTGKQMAAEISSNNEIKVRDGVLMHQGCAASIKKNTYDSLSIVNGSQGMKRIDLIVARYERNENTGVESLTLKVLKGTPASANPATPAYTTGDIQAGDYIADMPMYKVTLDGINITKLEKQFQTVETNATLTQKVNELNSTMNMKSKSVSVRTDASIPYYANEFICVNRTNADVTTLNVGTFSTGGLFTFAEDMIALFVASISGRPDSTGRIWLNLVRYSDNYKYDSNIIYGGYATCTFSTVIKAKKGDQIALGTVENFQMNSGGFTSNMAVIRLD